MFVVYQIVDPVTTEIIYFGRSKDIDKREYQHNQLCKTGFDKELYNYWNEHHPGLDMVLEPIYQCKTEVESKQYEMYCILDWKFRVGKKLYNKIPRIRD